MGDKSVSRHLQGQEHRSFMSRILDDLRALERLIADGAIENGVRRIGAEQELILVDSHWRPAAVAMEVLPKIDDSHFTNELGLTEAWHSLRIVNVADGTNEILNRTIAQRLLKGDTAI